MVAQIRKPVVVNIKVEEDDEWIAVSADYSEFTLIENEIRNLFKETSSKEELDDELKSCLQALLVKPSFPQIPAMAQMLQLFMVQTLM